MRGLADISSHVTTNIFSTEFTTQGIYRCRSIRFWKSDILTRVELHRHHQGEVDADCYWAAISYLLSFVSSKSGLVSVSGCSSMVFYALETCGRFKIRIQYPFRFEVLILFSPGTHAPERPTDQTHLWPHRHVLAAQVLGCSPASQPWALQCPELCKVSLF